MQAKNGDDDDTRRVFHHTGAKQECATSEPLKHFDPNRDPTCSSLRTNECLRKYTLHLIQERCFPKHEETVSEGLVEGQGGEEFSRSEAGWGKVFLFWWGEREENGGHVGQEGCWTDPGYNPL